MGRLGIIIFARSSSKRLPNKVLKKICTIPLLKLIVSRVKKSSLKYQIIINTSSHKSDDKIIKFCKNENIKYFRGDLENVFDRTIKCCKKFKLKAFVRINADRPYLDYKLIDKMAPLLLCSHIVNFFEVKLQCVLMLFHNKEFMTYIKTKKTLCF